MTRLTILVALSAALTPGCCGLKTSRHANAALSVSETDAILAAARSTLAVADSPDDTQCHPDKLQRSGSVDVFTTGSGIITSKEEHEALNHGYNRVKVVQDITWCNGKIKYPVLGCSSSGGPLIVVRSDIAEGVLWAHEFGHTRGLSHRDEDHALMYSIHGASHTHVTANECHNIERY